MATREIYFAGGCFWGTEKLFQGITGVVDAHSGYANGNTAILPNYERVCMGNTGYKETVRVIYNPDTVSLRQLLTAFFHVIDPTVKNRQGNDIGTQYQTGIYFADDESEAIVRDFVAVERQKYSVFAVEVDKLSSFFMAEEYHQDYLDKNPNGYCHISQHEFEEINRIIGTV